MEIRIWSDDCSDKQFYAYSDQMLGVEKSQNVVALLVPLKIPEVVLKFR